MVDFSPAATVRDWPKGQKFTIADAVTGVACFGGTGSGKTVDFHRDLTRDFH